MKISKLFNLDKTQFELDFVDINTEGDLPLFIDPYFLSIRNDSWSLNATKTIQSFFSYFIQLVKDGNNEIARDLFSYLHEPNETCLGMSIGKPSGRGIGNKEANDIFESIIKSEAINSGVLEHLEDTRIFVDGIGKDKISDMTTNIIRKDLIQYTQQQCKLHNIPMQVGVPTGYIWDKINYQWVNDYDEMLVINGKKILLVPKAIVSFTSKYTPEHYLQHFVLNYLQQENLSMGSALVQRRKLKNGTVHAFVTKKSIRETMEFPKEYLKTFTLRHPNIFKDFKNNIKSSIKQVSQQEYSSVSLEEVIDHLIQSLRAIDTGTKQATAYHRIIVGILELIFYPYLVTPTIENEIHSGRKRIDISFDNAADSGFFSRLSTSYEIPCQFIHVECKNYSTDISNPELDQISGRFSPNRGKFGFIVCRNIDNMDAFLERCANTYADSRGLVMPLVDNDLISLMIAIKNERPEAIEELLMNRFRAIGLR